MSGVPRIEGYSKVYLRSIQDFAHLSKKTEICSLGVEGRSVGTEEGGEPTGQGFKQNRRFLVRPPSFFPNLVLRTLTVTFSPLRFHVGSFFSRKSDKAKENKTKNQTTTATK